MALGDSAGAQNDFCTALHLAYQGGFTPSTLNALTGLAALESQQIASQETFELVLYIAQHPASTRETKDLAVQLQRELEAKLHPEQVDVVEQNTELKSLDEFVRPFLTSFHSR
jgi:hypothetical protein